LLLESAFNDPSLRKTSFVIVHGGGIYAPRATRMVRDGEVSRARAEEIATRVMRTDAATLYNLGLK